MPNLATCDKLIAKFLQCVIFLRVMCSKNIFKAALQASYTGFAWTRQRRLGLGALLMQMLVLKSSLCFVGLFIPPPSCSLRSPTWQGLQMGCARRRGWRQPCDGNVNLLCRPGEAPGNSPRNAFCSAGPRGGICHRHPAAVPGAWWRALSLSTPTAFN